ncbi:hypothetical protein PQJ75_23565 [Rhodoplanes sp. TEM]|uniref:Acid stress chaperone HdeA n=1 Tax=Rhodoplanes tepidamans TaxID=200616 RepID=A0ABT5JJJ0_RHOTP|nr:MULTISPECIES: hypothetical protein [Rhodoplanes]MDC7789543.1 hypothetical protein [Rhodoplanes tepidamans]MDC7986718.1 hypothetical protein [Rhodoplanes sp. TEM]MDQ0359168.1 hypothetical protein [Rhodoplanes tepidamans]
MIGRTFVALVLAAGLIAPSVEARAEPLVAQGIGSSSCGKLVADLKPTEGLQNPVNLMLYAWVQGYLSAANVSLLELDGKHVDLGALDEAKVIAMVATYCKANPDHKPMAAVDDFIRKAAKLRAKWDVGTVNWNG